MVTTTCLVILRGERSIMEFNDTNAVLLPKNKNPYRVRDFRPISLLTVIYKVVTKTLANRLKHVANDSKSAK